MPVMIAPGLLPKRLEAQIKSCPSCEPDRRPRMFVCDYHDGWWDGYEAGKEEASG